jgi:hypothetical protein
VSAAFSVQVQAATVALAVNMLARVERLRALEQELGPQVKAITVHSTATIVSVDGIRTPTLRPRKGGIDAAVFSPGSGPVPWFSDVRVARSVD